MSPLIAEADSVSPDLLEAILVNMVEPNKASLLPMHGFYYLKPVISFKNDVSIIDSTFQRKR